MSRRFGKALLCYSFLTLVYVILSIGLVQKSYAAEPTTKELVTSIKSLSATPGCGCYSKKQGDYSCNDADYGEQYFDLSVNWGSMCTGAYSCKILSWDDNKPSGYTKYLKPWCYSGYGDCPTASDVESYSTSYIKDKEHYDATPKYVNKFYLLTIISKQSTTQNVKAIIRRKVPAYTLEMDARDSSSGASLSCTSSVVVRRGNSGTISSSGCNPSGYTWEKWEDSSDCGTSRSCTQTNITADKTVKAYYKKSSYSLTAKAVDKNGNSLSSVVADRTKTGNYNTQVTVNKGSPAGYTFQNCWRTSTTGSCASTGDSYSTTLTSNATVYDVYEINRYTLTAHAIDTDGNTIKEGIDTKTVNYNTKATVSKTDITGYTFKGWRKTKSDTTYTGGTGNSYSVNNMTSNVTVYAEYELNVFEGKSVVSGDVGATIDWTVSTTELLSSIDDCSPIYGCHVEFTHYLKRERGGGTTGYKVTRTSNLTTTSRKVDNNNNVASGSTNKDGAEQVVSQSDSIILYPGMIVCESLIFAPYNTANSRETTLTVCVFALGNAQPAGTNPDGQEDPNSNSGDMSLINMKVRNADVSRYNRYQREIYAKPGDNLTYRSTYFPNLQYTYYLVPQKMKINNGSVFKNSNKKTLGEFYNVKKSSSLKKWNNGYSAQKLTINATDVDDIFAGSIYNTESYTNLYEVPKLVIYAENNNIIINCNVTRIDAVLVANNVKTCNSDDINSAPNSTQLTINGAIIANSLTANRTYGAAQGVNSIVPAEIIDFDSTLYLWGGSKDDTETTEPDNTINGDLETTYLHESPPRY